MPLTVAMDEDDFLTEAAGWAGYYERARKLIEQVVAARLADKPPQAIIDDPSSFNRWLEQCDQAFYARMAER